MRHNSSTFVGWQGAILVIAVIVAGVLEPAYCQTYDPVLLLQQTPPEAGKVTPAVGVHHFDLNTDVTLTAVPKPGYQFVYWLGDVSDPTDNSTIVYLDAPKIVIAVFERAEYELLVVDEIPRSAPVGGLFASPADFGRLGFGGLGGRRPRKFRRPEPPEPEEPDDFPVPIPEPATAILLGLGGLFAFVGRRKKRQL
jgi:hypothetical protein